MSSFSSPFARALENSRCLVALIVWFMAGWSYPLYVANAQQERSITLIERVHFTGEVQNARLIVAGAGNSIHSEAVAWIRAPQEDEVTCVGRVSVIPGEELLQVLFVITGTKGEVRSTFKSLSVGELSPMEYLSLADLRSRLVERRSLLRQLDAEVRMQEERVTGLQSDADAIANVAKIVDVEDELEEVKRRIQLVETASQGVEQRKAQMLKRPAPLNAQTRETELVKQLSELSSALSVTETGALKGISKASGELQEKLRLIEETRDEHMTLLEEELAELQRRRKP